MTSLQKEALYIKWNSCDRDTRIRIACEYLNLIRRDEEEISWLCFLNNNLEEVECLSPKNLSLITVPP